MEPDRHPQPSSVPPWRRVLVLVGLAGGLTLASLLTFDALHHGPLRLYDALILGRGGGDLARGGIGVAFGSTLGGMRRPLLWLALEAEGGGAGNVVSAVHVASAILHALTATLVGLLCLACAAPGPGRLARTAAGAATYVWFLHPLRVEPVAWASDHGTVLGGALIAASAVAWLGAVSRPRWKLAGFPLSIGLLCLALLADPTLFLAPVALLALTLWVRRDEPSTVPEIKRPVWIASIPGALALVATLAVRESGGGPPFLASMLAGASILVRPIRATLWPAGLHPGYDPPPGFPDEIAPSLWLDGVWTVVLVSACVWGLRRRHGLGVTLLAYLALATGRVVLRQDVTGADGDAYVATIPLFVGTGVVLARLTGRIGRAGFVVPLAAMTAGVLLGLEVTAPQVNGWTDEATLTRHVLDIDPANERALVAQGDAARRAGAALTEASVWYRRALDAGDWRPLAHARLGGALLESGDVPGARQHLERSIAIAPGLPAARFDLGALELREGHLDAARVQLEAAARLDPDVPDVWRVLSMTCDRLGDRTAADAAMKRALSMSKR